MFAFVFFYVVLIREYTTLNSSMDIKTIYLSYPFLQVSKQYVMLSGWEHVVINYPLVAWLPITRVWY